MKASDNKALEKDDCIHYPINKLDIKKPRKYCTPEITAGRFHQGVKRGASSTK